MKYAVLGACLLTILAFPYGARAQESWEIIHFNSDIQVTTDGNVKIQETIDVDFGNLEKHGIYRDLPYVYASSTGPKIYTRISDIQAMQDGRNAIVDLTRNSANLRVRIGDPDRTISGQHRYVISYTVLGALQAFNGFDELNWNITGNDWEVPIKQASATISIPTEILQAACYTGQRGSTVPCELAAFTKGVATFTAKDLAAQEGLTAAVGYTSGVILIVAIAAPASLASLVFSSTAIIPALLILITGVLMVLKRWWRYGRDRYWQRAHLPGESSQRDGVNLPERTLPLFSAKPVSVEYESPEGLRPAEIGVLIDERADTLDVTATIVDLASRGYLEITEKEKIWVFGKKDYEFTRTTKKDQELMEYERELLTRLFGGESIVALSALKNTFYKDLQVVKNKLYTEVVRKKMFPERPSIVRAKAAGMGVFIIMIGMGLTIGAGVLFDNATTADSLIAAMAGSGIALILVGIVALIFSRIMPRKTGYGREIYERARGYQMFVSGTEKYRAKFNEDKGLFVTALPYAIMFGVTDKLARAFKDMGIEPPAPAWYHGATAFNVASFSNSMSDFSKSLSSAMASAPSSSGSSGSGFSGGGFGGGGGGSW